MPAPVAVPVMEAFAESNSCETPLPVAPGWENAVITTLPRAEPDASAAPVTPAGLHRRRFVVSGTGAGRGYTRPAAPLGRSGHLAANRSSPCARGVTCWRRSGSFTGDVHGLVLPNRRKDDTPWPENVTGPVGRGRPASGRGRRLADRFHRPFARRCRLRCSGRGPRG